MIPIKDAIPASRFPIVMWSLVIINALAFLLELSLDLSHLESLIRTFGLIPARMITLHFKIFSGVCGWLSFGCWLSYIIQGAWMPLVSSMFLHGGWMHFISNMWSLYLFGDNVEDKLGHFRFLIFYLSGGIFSGLLHVVLHPETTLPAIGASGAISAVMGAYFILFPFAKIIVLFPIFIYPLFAEVPAVFYLILWFLTQLWSGAYTIVQAKQNVGGVAFWAHIGGFIAGMALLAVFIPKGKQKARKRFDDEYYPW